MGLLYEEARGFADYMVFSIVIMKSDYANLVWPFTKCFTCILVDQHNDLSQRKNIEQAFIPNVKEGFKTARQRGNDGLGQPQFIRMVRIH